MARRIAFTLALALFGAVEASGQADGVDVYFDQAASSRCIVASPVSLVSVYVVYSDPSVSEIGGFDVGVSVDQYLSSPPQIAEVLTPCAASITDIGQISVRCATPIACTTQTTLCEIRMLFLGGVTRLSVTGPTTPSLPVAGPFVVLGDGSALSLSEGDTGALIDGGFEYCEGLSGELTTWGAVKSLYRQQS